MEIVSVRQIEYWACGMGFKFRTKCVVACGTHEYTLEINEANISFLLRSQVSSSNKINEKKKTNWVSCLQKKYNKLRTMPSQEQRNVWDVNVQVTERSQNFKYEHEDSTHSWRLRNKNNNFYLNVTERLARPGGTKLSKLREEMSQKELNVFLKSFRTSAKKKDGTLSAQLNPSKSRH